MRSQLNLFAVAGAIVAGDNNPGANRNPIEKTNEQEDSITRGTDSRQGFTAQKVTDDQRVGRVVKLLKQIAEKDRQGKEQNLFPDHTFGH